ncbi:MAG: hypothetical protein AAF787_03855, partial [Chloroflexota bacterium]
IVRPELRNGQITQKYVELVDLHGGGDAQELFALNSNTSVVMRGFLRNDGFAVHTSGSTESVYIVDAENATYVEIAAPVLADEDWPRILFSPDREEVIICCRSVYSVNIKIYSTRLIHNAALPYDLPVIDRIRWFTWDD